MVNDVAKISDRLQEAMNIRGLKQVDLVERTQIPKGSISQYVSGFVEPKSDRIYLLANALSVNPVWLMGIDAPMDAPIVKPTKNETSIINDVLANNPELKNYILNYDSYSELGHNLIKAALKSLEESNAH